ncbi:MAG: hypothetical protein P8L77_03910 [Gammaproteobacteria bacterium]|nr:hypothetical protein [Gammaproteobacteria bacterium]
MAKQQEQIDTSYSKIVETYLDLEKLDSCDLVKQPFSLTQTNFKRIYQQLNQTHYENISDKIKGGMCYGYTILWLASMRVVHERKLLDQTDFSPEQVCFFKVIQILAKYENADVNTMPDDTRKYFEESLKYLETSFNTIKDIQEKQSPDDFFEPNNNDFIFLLPNKDDKNEDEFYTHLYETLSSLSAGTCIQIDVPRHAIGCYIGKDKIYLLDPNDDKIVTLDKLSPQSKVSQISLFEPQTINTQLDKMNISHLNMDISQSNTASFKTELQIYFLQYYKNDTLPFISFNLLTSQPNEHAILNDFTNNSIALESETLDKLTELDTAGNRNYFIQLVNSDFLSEEYKISLQSKLISKIRDKLIDSDEIKNDDALFDYFRTFSKTMSASRLPSDLLIKALKDVPPEILIEKLPTLMAYNELKPLIAQVLKDASEKLIQLAQEGDLIQSTMLKALYNTNVKDNIKEIIIPLVPFQYFTVTLRYFTAMSAKEKLSEWDIKCLNALADLLETANKNLSPIDSIFIMRTLEELRSKIIQKYPDDNNTLQPAINHLNNAINDCEQAHEAYHNQSRKPGP